jgi:hypothetical protein
MNASTVSSIVSMPVGNFIILCVTALGTLGMIGVILDKVGFLQVGPFTMKKNQDGQTTMHNMDNENEDADDLLKARLRQMTTALRQRVINSFGEFRICAMTRRTLASSLRFPLYESIGNNHYTKELMSDRFVSYRSRMLASLEDEYVDIALSVSNNSDCAEPSTIPDWNIATKLVEDILDRWLLEVVRLVAECCRQKISNYEKYLAIYTGNHDKYRAGIAEACVEKNKRYITDLDQRVALIQVSLEKTERELS